nr:PD-(D/E)XK nuclease-like domain-containing protein [Nocardioides panaciterrulae]
MKQILKSPAHFLHSRTHPQTSAALDLGTVAHSMVLGTGPGFVAVEGNRNRNDVKAAIAEAEAEGKVVLKPEQLAAAERMADAVFTHPKASRLLTSPGRSELSMFWRDPAYDVIRRCRWDRLGDDGIGVDLKTSRTSDPAALPKHIVEYGYDLSAAWYLDVAAGLGVDIAAYALVFVESTEPHPVVVAELSGDFLERGAALAGKALATYRRCLDTGTWPAYCDDDFLTIHPPRWADTAEFIANTIPEGTAA